MAEIINQLPAKVDVYMVDDDDLVLNITLGIDVTGYTFSAGVIVDDTTTVSMTVTTVTASTGVIKAVLASTSIDTEVVPGTYTWYLKWTDASGYIRTIIAGNFFLRSTQNAARN